MATFSQSLLLPFNQDNPAIMMATHAQNLLRYAQIGSAITTAIHAQNLLLYAHIGSAITTATQAQNLSLFFVRNNPANSKLHLIVVFIRRALTAQTNVGLISIPDENYLCSVFQMVAYGHKIFIESRTSFNDGSFQLVVKSILILHSEGAQVASASASFQTFADGDQAASQSDTSKLIIETPSLLLLHDFERPAITAVMNGSFSFKFIVASHSEGAQFAPNFDRPSNLDSSKLIVIFLEISFHFCEDYRIFREGEYQVKNDGYAIDEQQSYLFNVLDGLVSFISLAIVGFVGLSLDSLGGLIGHISLVGRCIIGLSGISGRVGRISLVVRIGLNGIIGLVGQTGLVGLIRYNGLVGLIATTLLAPSASVTSAALSTA